MGKETSILGGDDEPAVVLRRAQLVQHLNEECTGISLCKFCPAKFRKGMKLPEKDFDHRCTDYIVRLMEEIVGPKAFLVAKDSLNRRITNREKLVEASPSKL